MNKLLAIFVGVLALSPLTGLAYFDQNLYFGLQKNVGVTALQEFLTEQNLYTGPITGNFFSLTLKAVKAFQTSKGITPVSGYFGPLTREAANNVLASQGVSQGVTDEAGITINPPVTAPKTNDDVVAKLNETIEQLKKQVAEAEKTNTSLAEVQAKQAEQKAILESQQQKLGAIQTNTTPAPTPSPVVPVAKEVVKDLVVTADKTTVTNSGWDAVEFVAKYTEDGVSKPAIFQFIGPDKSHVQDSRDAITSFAYKPTSIGSQTVTVKANNFTRTVDIQVTEYVKKDAEVKSTGTSRTIRFDGDRAIASFDLTQGDEPVSCYYLTFESDIQDPEVLFGLFLNNGASYFKFSSNSNGKTGCGATGLSTAKITFSSNEPAILEKYKGTHTFKITDIEAYGAKSGKVRAIQGLPLTFTYTIQ